MGEDKYLVCVDGISKGVFDEIPEDYQDLELFDFSGKAARTSGLIDLHVHAPQYKNRGLGMDLELLDWLNTYTFPERPSIRMLPMPKRPIKILSMT